MKRIAIFLLLVPLCLFGCVGIIYPKGYVTHEIESSPDPEFFVSKDTGKRRYWNTIPHEENGKVYIYEKHGWCGPVIFILIPVPLMLPVCEYNEYAEFVDGKPVSIKGEGTEKYDGILCGPGIYMMTMAFEGSPTPKFCATEFK